ncbi:MAG: type II toxin-antitoxin system prevent-host-death family antitoxin [Phycisphaerae bacterium]|nr:type II toxin-antitoxin system prevent-host-death family antitoxin [Phycisphaerae bacterium]
MKRMSIREARRCLSEIVKAAERGDATVITRRGRDVAQVTPTARAEGKSLPDLTEFRRSIPIKGKALSRTVVSRRARERY